MNKITSYQWHRIESSIGLPVYKTHMKLTIINISSGDDGIYKCVAKNPRGETDGIIRLYGKNIILKQPRYDYCLFTHYVEYVFNFLHDIDIICIVAN